MPNAPPLEPIAPPTPKGVEVVLPPKVLPLLAPKAGELVAGKLL